MELERFSVLNVNAAKADTPGVLLKSVSLGQALTLINRMVSERGEGKGTGSGSDASEPVQDAFIPFVPARGFAISPVVVDQEEPVQARMQMPIVHRATVLYADTLPAETPKAEPAEAMTAEERISAFMWAAAERAVSERASREVPGTEPVGEPDVWAAVAAAEAEMDAKAAARSRTRAAAEVTEPARLLEWIPSENPSRPAAVATVAEESVLLTFPAPQLKRSAVAQDTANGSRLKRLVKWLLCWGWDEEDDDVEPDTQYGTTFTSEPLLARPWAIHRKTS